jgi:hypothetical protein
VHLYAVCVAVIASVWLLAIGDTTAIAKTVPTKFVPSLRFGWKVKGLAGNVCATSEEACGFGEESEQPGGFSFAETVAVADDGHVYVGGRGTRRIQEFGENGEFLSMFGWNVNRTKEKGGATQAERDTCSAAEVGEGAECVEGEAGSGEGSAGAQQMFDSTESATVDQASGDLYVLDTGYARVDEFTASGEFILAIGGQVNKTKVLEGADEAEQNLCTAASLDVCQAGVAGTGEGAFEPQSSSYGDLLEIGGPSDSTLYVADKGRVQEFEVQSGRWSGQISLSGLSLSGSATAIAVDTAGDLFVVDSEALGVHEYNEKGELQALVIDPEGGEEGRSINALALDFYGRLALIEQEPTEAGEQKPALGLLYGPAGEFIDEFTPPSSVPGKPASVPGQPRGLTFDASNETDRLYVAGASTHDIEAYDPFEFPTVSSCPAKEVLSTSAILCGEINPNAIPAEGLFEYGPLGGSLTQSAFAFKGEGTALESYEAPVSGLVPNETYRFAAAVQARAQRASASMLRFHTRTPPPEIAGAPEASFVKGQSAVLNASIDPEHAPTAYHFQYAEYEKCARLEQCAAADVAATAGQQDAQYGQLAVAEEAHGLKPSKTYVYRLVANNEFKEEREVGVKEIVSEGGASVGAQGTFTTEAAPTVAAQTGLASAIGATGAIISGMVEAGGEPAAYRFELSTDTGVVSDYGVVSSGYVPADRSPVAEFVELGGLQPSTTYLYRIVAESGYGTAYGAPVAFSTGGLASLLLSPAALPLLAPPNVAFPGKTKTTTLTNAQKLASALEACRKKPKDMRAACERQARRRYGAKDKRAKARKGAQGRPRRLARSRA